MTKKYLYHINSDIKNSQLVALEMKSLFKNSLHNNILNSDINIKPSVSPFIKERLEIIYSSNSFENIIDIIKKNNFKSENFRIEYLRHKDDIHTHAQRLDMQIKVSYAIDGIGTIKNQDITFAITNLNNKWFFGEYLKNDYFWRSHNNKPHSYSNAMSADMSRSIINIATGLNKSIKVIDPCCGIGTVVLEGLDLGIDIYGNEINIQIASNAIENIKFFKHKNVITTGDMHDIKDHYDVSILDIPYGLFSDITSDQQLEIIKTCRRISDKLILICAIDMQQQIEDCGFILKEKIKVAKNSQNSFTRTILVCI